MEAWIIPALIVAVAMGFALWKNKDKVSGIFDRKDETPGTPIGTVSTPAAQPAPAPVATPVTPYEQMTEAQWNAYLDTMVPTTRAYFPTWARKQVIDKQIADMARAAGPGPNRDTFALTFENGYLVHPTVAVGVPNAFYVPVVPGMGVLRVYGVGGDQVNVVNGQSVNREAILPAPSDGVALLSADGVGQVSGMLRLGVQLVP